MTSFQYFFRIWTLGRLFNFMAISGFAVCQKSALAIFVQPPHSNKTLWYVKILEYLFFIFNKSLHILSYLIPLIFWINCLWGMSLKNSCKDIIPLIRMIHNTYLYPIKLWYWLAQYLDECLECHVKRPNLCRFFVDHPYIPKSNCMPWTCSNNRWQHGNLKVKLTWGVQVTRSRHNPNVLFSHMSPKWNVLTYLLREAVIYVLAEFVR